MGELDNLRFIVEGLGLVSTLVELHPINTCTTFRKQSCHGDIVANLDFFAGVCWHFWNNRQHFWNPLVFQETHSEEFPPG